MIKEYDLDAPTLPKADRSAFRSQSRSLTNLFERIVAGRVQIKNRWKVLVEVVPEIKFKQSRNLLGVEVIQIQGQADRLLDMPEDQNKQETALRWLLKGCEKLGEEFDLGFTEFSAVADEIRAIGYKNIEVWGDSTHSPTGEYVADVLVDRNSFEAKVIGRISKPNVGISQEKLLFITHPDEFRFADKIGRLKWVSEREVQLLSRDGNERWLFDLATTQPRK